MSDIIALVQNLPKTFATFLLSVLPWTELRMSIPIAIHAWGMDPVKALFVSVAGNLIPMFFILYLFDPLQRIVTSRFPLARRMVDWLYSRTRHKLSGKYHKYGKIALCIFVAFPVPGTGVWTGSLAAWLFNIDRKSAILYITIGALASGLAVTILTVGIKTVFNI